MKPTGIEALVCDEITLRQQKFGRWSLVNLVECGKHEKWLARCSCGNEKIVFIENLKRGKSTSCGCLRAEKSSLRCKTHGQSRRTAEYRTWAHLKGRCLNPKDDGFKDYGGRGIKVCDRWLSFENFYQDMGSRPPGHSIERVDVNGNYEPSNCVWLPIKHQARNTRATRFKQEEVDEIRKRLSAGEAAKKISEEYGVSAGHIRQIKRGEIWKQ